MSSKAFKFGLLCLGILVIVPGFNPVSAIDPVPEANPEIDKDLDGELICGMYRWMIWPTHESWYALRHNSACVPLYPQNYDRPLGSTSQNCLGGTCDSAKKILISRKSGNVTGENKGRGHNPELQNKIKKEKLNNIKVATLEEHMTDPEDPENEMDLETKENLQVDYSKTSHDYVRFRVRNNENNKVEQVFVVLRHIRLKRREFAPGTLEKYPEVLSFSVGQEIEKNATVDGGEELKPSDFILLPQHLVELAEVPEDEENHHVLNVNLFGTIYQVVTSTPVGSIPP